MKLLLLSTLIVAIPMGVNAWVLQSDRQFRTTSHRFMSDPDVETTDNPCWQDVYGDADDDCGMSTVYSSTFVAEKWIKSMPCGHDVDVS